MKRAVYVMAVLCLAPSAPAAGEWADEAPSVDTGSPQVAAAADASGQVNGRADVPAPAPSNPPAPAAAPAPARSAPARTPGSLYDEASYHALAADSRARRVGDVITVRVYENTSAQSTTDTATERKQQLNASIAFVPGSEYAVSGGIGGKFEGGGTTQRANKLLATVTVTVREILPGGDLQIAGEQLITVNAEEQKVTVAGRVRPQDISGDNVVLSTRISDARITFLGQGALSSRQRRPIWRYILEFLGF